MAQINGYMYLILMEMVTMTFHSLIVSLFIYVQLEELVLNGL